MTAPLTDSLGNRYVVSEAHVGVLRVSPAGSAEWLRLPDTLVRQARASGMLLHFNAIFEGLAINPAGDQMWLAAERQSRGLLLIKRQQREAEEARAAKAEQDRVAAEAAEAAARAEREAVQPAATPVDAAGSAAARIAPRRPTGAGHR